MSAQGSLVGAVTRVACVRVPALSLQLALRAHPAWRDNPIVVVEDDRPQATILECNRAARAHRIQRGMSFAQAKALSATLRSEVHSEPALATAIDTLFDQLLAFSPRIEPVLLQPGLFWLDPNGLDPVFGNLLYWTTRLHLKLQSEGFVSTIACGFTRGPLWAIAHVRAGALVVRDREEEARLCAQVSIARLGISARLREQLQLLDIKSVGELLTLPATQLRVRYGAEAARLHDFLNGKTWSPLLPRTPVEPLCAVLEVDPPDDDVVRLLFGLKGLLHGVADRLARDCAAVTALSLVFELERLGTHQERIETAAPTLEVPQLVDLLRLRLSNLTLTARVERILVTVEHTRVHPRQIAIAHGPKTRDLDAAARAIARLRASFGPEAVTCARLREAHLPEASFRFEPTRTLALPKPQTLHATLPLVRRVYASPRTLPVYTDDAVLHVSGPYRIEGGWWSPRGTRQRDYYFLETKSGDLLWLYRDRIHDRWLLQGMVG